MCPRDLRMRRLFLLACPGLLFDSVEVLRSLTQCECQQRRTYTMLTIDDDLHSDSAERCVRCRESLALGLLRSRPN
ncbi:hypothetical protein BDV93DRAFT_140084 [Ceratobasidium sp. AG-I]|nr:hypothetical protein BDV93DRAFT_140084 [Ceratobasidium sp. AG-I]